MVVVEGVARSLDPEINMWEIAAPIVRQAIVEAIGPQRQARRVREAFSDVAEILPLIPQAVRAFAASAEETTSPAGQRTERELADTVSSLRNGIRIALIISVLSLGTAMALALR
jgi:ubiquinone biosynthesis protein